MVNTLKVIRRANFQFLLVAVVAVSIGVWQRMDASGESIKHSEKEVEIVEGLPVKNKSISEVKENRYGSDKKWNSFKKELDKENVIYEGSGIINDKKVEVEFFLSPEGHVSGRYHHENGTKLDLNVYVDQSTGALIVQLGHESNKTLSNWHLIPSITDNEKEIYEYEGSWGKNGLPSKLTVHRKSI